LAGPKLQDKVMLHKVSEAYNKRLYPICTGRLTKDLQNSEISSLFAEEMHKISQEEDGYQILDWVFNMYLPSIIIRVRPKTLHMLNEQLLTFREQDAYMLSYGQGRHYALNEYFIMTDAIAIYAQRYVHDNHRSGMIEEVQAMNGVLRKMIDAKMIDAKMIDDA
jgi:hypothetical protein